MNDRKQMKEAVELSGRIHRLIDREIKDGLKGFRAGDFEARLAARMNSGRRPGPARASWARILLPGAALAGAAALMLIILSHSGGRHPAVAGSAVAAFSSALEGRTGFQSVEMTRRIPAAGTQAPSPAVVAMFRSLAAAAGAADAEAAPAIPDMDGLVPRYDLNAKIEILIGQKAIERAFSIYLKAKYQGGSI